MRPNGKISVFQAIKNLFVQNRDLFQGTNCKPTQTVPFIFYSKNPFLNGREFMALGALENNDKITLNDEIEVRFEYEVCQSDWLGMINFDQPDLSTGIFYIDLWKIIFF